MRVHVDVRGYLIEMLAARPDLIESGLTLDSDDIACYRADVDANHPHAEEGYKQALAVYTAYFHPHSAHNVATAVATREASPEMLVEPAAPYFPDPRIEELGRKLESIADDTAAITVLSQRQRDDVRNVQYLLQEQARRDEDRKRAALIATALKIIFLILILITVFATRAHAQGKDQLVIQLQNNGATLGTAGGVLKLNCATATYSAHVWTCTSVASGGAAWGSITGTLSTQTDLNTALTARELTANKDAASGYAGLTASSLLKAAEFPILSGDCTTAGGALAITCTKTNGVAFATSATTDTTNAANISSGALPAGRMPALTGDCTTSAGAVSVTCGNAIARTGGSANQYAISGGASSPITYLDHPDVKVIIAGVCNNGIAGSAWGIGSGGSVLCRAGTNNLGAYVSISDTSSTFATFQVVIPEDWDSTTNPYIRFQLASTDATNNHTIIPSIQIACYKGDGSTTDDVTPNAAHSLSTTTLNGNANRFWSTSNVQMNSTDVTGCVAGALMQVTVGRATDTATNCEFYSATLTFPRRPLVQAN